MIVVADTTPLNYLIQLELADVLQDFYGRVVVPPAVLEEMQHSAAPLSVQGWAAAPPLWLEKVAVQQLDTTLAAELGAGEREAISLALELRAEVLLIDEAAGRRQAAERHLPVTGTLTVLLQASLRGYCDFRDAVLRLRQYGFWVSASTEALMMARYEASRKQF